MDNLLSQLRSATEKSSTSPACGRESCPSTVPPSEVSPVCIVLFSVVCIWMRCCREQRLSSRLLFTLSSLRQALTILRVRQFGWTGWPANPKDPLVSASPTYVFLVVFPHYSPHSISSLLCMIGKRHTHCHSLSVWSNAPPSTFTEGLNSASQDYIEAPFPTKPA